MPHILTLNAGSSPIKFSLFDAESELIECVRGQVEGLSATARLQAERDEGHWWMSLSTRAR
jgi:acetate kinase